MAKELTDAEKARKKEAHRRSMIVTGWVTVASGLAAAYLAFAGTVKTPGFLFGRLGRPDPEPKIVARRAARPLARWRAWSPALLKEARRHDRLLFLNLSAPWDRASRLMDETAYADPAVARFLSRNFIPVIVDADLRPDLVRRYLGPGWPTVAVLLPTGEILDAASFMDGKSLVNWARTLSEAFRERRAALMDASAEAAEKRRKAISDEPRPQSARELLSEARRELEAEWDPATEGFGRGPRFPHFARAGALLSLKAPWASELGRRAAAGALALEDRVWGGFYRYAKGPGWQNPSYERRLEDQAEAIAALAKLEPAAALRTWKFVEAFLADPRGGYYASLAPEVPRPDGHVVEGEHYFSLDNAKRRALGLPPADRRVLAGPSARMAQVLLEAGLGREHALKTLDRVWKEAVEPSGRVRRAPGGPAGLLDDQLALIKAFLSANQEARSRKVWAWTEANLKDPKTGAFFDRPAAGELPPGLDRALLPDLNLEAYRLSQALGKPSKALKNWLIPRAPRLDPALRAVFASALQ